MEFTENDIYKEAIRHLETTGNLRKLPSDLSSGLIDFTSNDYLGLGADPELRERFFAQHDPATLPLTSSASRLLASNQGFYSSLESTIENSYQDALGGGSGTDPRALLFNSGYHANTGIIPALAGKSDLIIADRLVHASIIDGIRLSGAEFIRFPHNDFQRLSSLLEKFKDRLTEGRRKVIVIVESIYSMDGDRADLAFLKDLKKSFPQLILYVDEAHAVGVSGPGGLGEAMVQNALDAVDILVGTFGKALASTGAFALVGSTLKQFLINKARSLIFSTALPPIVTAWSEFVWNIALTAKTAREKLAHNSRLLSEFIPGGAPSHIRPLIIGDAEKTVRLSSMLADNGFNVLPIRTPTVPPTTERLRFSLSASIQPEDIIRLKDCLSSINSKQPS